ncbi:hypothetical protein IG631_02825 [Alternaria alternata]|nr:hypothetical protein IG631_02825 [Alternaria alternata]
MKTRPASRDARSDGSIVVTLAFHFIRTALHEHLREACPALRAGSAIIGLPILHLFPSCSRTNSLIATNAKRLQGPFRASPQRHLQFGPPAVETLRDPCMLVRHYRHG